MYTIERKSAIVGLLEAEGAVDVAYLASRFGVSKETVRRDLRELETEGVVKRTHGGAVLPGEDKEMVEYPVMVRSMQRLEEKRIICTKAASLIEDGDTIFVDNSSTTINLLGYINCAMRVTVVTNSLQLVIESAKLSNLNLQIVCLGGLFRKSNFSVFGHLSQENAKSFYPTKSFMSCRGIDSHGILTDGSIYEVELKQFMIDRSQQNYVLADYTKFNQVGAVYLSELSKIHHIITDNKIDPDVKQHMIAQGVQLHIAGKSENAGEQK